MRAPPARAGHGCHPSVFGDLKLFRPIAMLCLSRCATTKSANRACLDPPGSGVDYCRLHEARPHARMRATCTDGTNHRANSTRCAGIFLATRSTNRSTAEASMSPNVSRATCACHRPSGVATGSDVVEFPADAQGELPACGRASPSPSCGSLCGEGPGEVDAEPVAAPVVQKPLPVHLVDGHTGCDA